MDRLCLPVGELPNRESFRGSVSRIESPLGIEFARVCAEPHEICGRYLAQEPAIWLTLLIDGVATLSYGDCSIELKPGDIAYGPTFVAARLQFKSEFRQLFVRIPRLTLNPRVFSPLSLNIGYLSARSGISHVLSGMLCALAQVIDEVSSEELRPVELSLTEFLMTTLGSEKSVFGLGGVTGARAAHLRRICQNIEVALSNPDLNLRSVAEQEGVSTRYVQKLFAEAGKSFNHYLRTRRLEHCRADLVSPLHAELSISAICYRWGFNGSAHFSRSFRKEFGVTACEYRRSEGTILDSLTDNDLQ